MFAIAPELALRLTSWSVQLAEQLLPQGTPSYTLDGETRFGRKGALAVHHDGSWHDFEGDAHGHGALSLIAHLQPDATPATVQGAARAWLQQHPGHGLHTVEGHSNDAAVSAREQVRAEFAKQVLGAAQAIAGSEIEIYLQSRGLQIPPDDVAAYYPNARAGEAALVGVLRKTDGRIVGVQLGYVDPRGRKSALPPQRNIFMAETNRTLRSDAAFRIAGQPLAAGEQTTKSNGQDSVLAALSDMVLEQFAREHADTLLFTEGLENAIALHIAMPYSAIVGYPGIGRLRHQRVRAKQRVIVFKDGDAPDVRAVKTLIGGIDHLLISEAEVKVTATPTKESDGSVKQDANSVLQAGGIAAVQALIAGAQPATLSNDGQIRRLAALLQAGARLQSEQDRVAVAKLLGIRRLSQLDQMVTALLPPLDDEETVDVLADLPWETPITDLGAVLDEALATLKRFVAADEVYLAAGVVWSAHTHLVQSEAVLLTVTPRALITAVAENSGKTTLLKGMHFLSARGMLFVNLTPASLFRVIDAFRPTLFVDEADTVFARGGNPELLSLINTGFERGGVVPRIEEIDGQREVVLFPVWAAMAMAAIGRLPVATTQSRCIVIALRRALAGEVPERLRPGMQELFTPTRRKLTRWAQDIAALPAVLRLSGLDNRIGDNWEPLRQVAELAGGRWPALIARSALTDAMDSADAGSLVPLLTDIRAVFGAQARLATTEILEGLLSLEEPSSEWDRVNRGREITAVWLARRLRGALPTDAESLRARQWRVGGKTVRGYPVEQFDDAIRRYLSTTGDSESSDELRTEPGPKETESSALMQNTRDPGQIGGTPRERPVSAVPSQKSKLGTPGTPGTAGSAETVGDGPILTPQATSSENAEAAAVPGVPGVPSLIFRPGAENSQCRTEENGKVPGPGSTVIGKTTHISEPSSELPPPVNSLSEDADKAPDSAPEPPEEPEVTAAMSERW